MVKITVFPDPENGLWHFNFNDGRYGCELTPEAFRGLVCQLVECGLYDRATEMICDANDVEDENE